MVSRDVATWDMNFHVAVGMVGVVSSHSIIPMKSRILHNFTNCNRRTCSNLVSSLEGTRFVFWP